MPRLALADADLHYTLHGEGVPVLFLQGVGVTGAGYGPQVRDLERDHRCIVLDNRGIGDSTGDVRGLTVDRMARDALAVVDSLGIDRVHVVGHSLGGVIAQRLAHLARDRTRSLSLLCTFRGGRDLRRPSMRLVWYGMRSRVGTEAMRAEAFVRMVMPDAYVAERGLTEVRAELEQVFGRSLANPPAVADAQLAALRAHDESDLLAELGGIPTWVASGAHDPIARAEFGRGLAAAIPGARYTEWADASHGLPIQFAKPVNDALRAHFAGSP